MKALLLTLCTGTACTTSGWDTPAKLSPVAEPRVQERWFLFVQYEADIWNRAVVPRGCPPPFKVTTEGHEVRLVPSVGWTHDNTVGFIDDHVEIRGVAYPEDFATDYRVLHELGHALGLDDSKDPASVMYGHFNPITEADVDDAVASLGCE